MIPAVGTIDKTTHWDEKVGKLWWNISKAKYYYPIWTILFLTIILEQIICWC